MSRGVIEHLLSEELEWKCGILPILLGVEVLDRGGAKDAWSSDLLMHLDLEGSCMCQYLGSG